MSQLINVHSYSKKLFPIRPPSRLLETVDGRGAIQIIRLDGRGNPVHRVDDSPDGINKRKQNNNTGAL